MTTRSKRTVASFPWTYREPETRKHSYSCFKVLAAQLMSDFYVTPWTEPTLGSIHGILQVNKY